MKAQILEVINNISANVRLQNTEGNKADAETEKFFGITLKEQQINSIKADIYDRFQIDVDTANGRLYCYIPGNVLYKMNFDSALKEKVYNILADYSSDKFEMEMQTLYPPVKKCTLVFDDNGNAVATLEADMERLEKDTEKPAKKRKPYLLRDCSLEMLFRENTYEPYQDVTIHGILATSYIRRNFAKKDDNKLIGGTL